MRRLLALLALALASALAAPPGARAQRTIARVIATSAVDGRFAQPLCHHGRTLRPSDQAAFTYALTREAQAADQPLIVDTGGLLSPHGVVRFAAEARPSAVAVMVKRLGYRALAFGLNDLAAPRPAMLELLRELREREIPMIASNVRCAPEAAQLCERLVDASDGPSIHTVDGRPTAVLSVLRANIGELVAPDRARGITLDPPRETLERLTRIAFEQGAEIVIAVVDAGIEGGPIQLATELDPEARPTLLLVAGSDSLLFARPSTVRPVLVGAPPDDAVEVRIRETEEMRSGFEMLAQPLEGRGVTVGEPVLDFIDRVGEDYCAAWGRPLRGGHLGRDEEMDAAAMLALVAEIVRETAGADVAVLNRQIVDERWRPAQEGALTASDVYVALEYDEPLQVADVDERWLNAVAANAQRSGNLVTPGLTWTASGDAVSGVKVGGHPLEGRASYRVVTIRFLAAGGDGALPELRRGAWQSLGDATLRTVALDFLERPREEDPRDAVDDPAESLEWIFRADADLTFSGSTITSPRRRCVAETPPEACVAGQVVDGMGVVQPAYSTTQLAQSDVLIFGLALDLAANATAPDWTWQNTGNLLYRTAWTEPAAGSGAVGFVEASDQVRIRSTLSWRGPRQEVEGGWYVPDPTVDLFIESELTEPADRDWHWFLTRPTVGLRFQLLDKLQVQLSGGIQAQPFDPESANDPVDPGVGATVTLAPWDFLKLDQQFARLAFTFDYFLTDLGETNAGALRGQLDASFDLAGPLAISLRFNLLMQHEDGQDVGVALSAIAGVRLGALGRTTGP